MMHDLATIRASLGARPDESAQQGVAAKPPLAEVVAEPWQPMVDMTVQNATEEPVVRRLFEPEGDSPSQKARKDKAAKSINKDENETGARS